jgi:hypothetical protein
MKKNLKQLINYSSIIINGTTQEYRDYLDLARKTLRFDIEKNTIINKSKVCFGDSSKIFVPKKAEHELRNHCDKVLLRAVDDDMNVAIEKCLIFLSELNTNLYNGNKWKLLYSHFLHDKIKNGKDNTYVYTKVIKVLLKGTPQMGAMIEIQKNKQGGDLYYSGVGGSRRFKLASRFTKCGLTPYTLTHKVSIQQIQEHKCKRLLEVVNNPIGRNLLHLYPHIQLPTEQEIRKEADRLLSVNYITKKGKRLRAGKKTGSRYIYHDTCSFVEDNIELYKSLTEGGFMVPVVTGENAGGRVVDSFTLMPSWIRNLIKIDGESIEELDYTALHPNIAISIYDGDSKFITHEKIQEVLGISKSEIKREHLSFFNKEWDDIVRSPLFFYYKSQEPIMMENIYRDKQENGHKSTSRKLFAKEVEIISKSIEFLNEEGIYVGYVYDALFCLPKHRDRVKRVMDYYAQEAGVCTRAK